MKFSTFSYTDLKGNKSFRKVLVMTLPSDKMAGIDVSELEDSEIGLLASNLEIAKQEYVDGLNEIYAEFDVRHNYRQFFPNKMTDVLEEDI